MLEKYKTFHFVGIGGISMSALAIILKNMGKVVTGTDAILSEITDKLCAEGIPVVKGACPCFVNDADVVVISGAISEEDFDLLEARRLGKLVLTRAELLGEISKKYKTIAISGSHGKTTTSALISHILKVCQLNPTIHIGGIAKNFDSNVVYSNGEYFVTEACEYKDSFLSLKPFIEVITNQKPDHLDYFKTDENYYQAFTKFSHCVCTEGYLVVNFDDPNNRNLKVKRLVTFALNEKADFTAKNIRQSWGKGLSFDVYFKDKKLGRVQSELIGKFNVYNILASVAVSTLLGISFDNLQKAIKTFKGVKRRCEKIVAMQDKTIYHDYAHHPDEIKAIISTFKQLSNAKLVVVFEPHTYTRTQALFSKFISSLSLADEVCLLPIYPAREKAIKGVSSLKLSNALKQNNINSRYFNSFDTCERYIASDTSQKTIFLLLGAGSIEKLAYRFE